MRKGIGFSPAWGGMVFGVAAAVVLAGRLLAPAPLAGFWPETAVLLALFLRGPAFVHPLAWVAAWLGALTAGLLFQSGVVWAGIEAAINLSGVFVAWQVLHTWGPMRPRPDTLAGLGRTLAAAILGAMSAAVLSALLAGALHGGRVAGHFALIWSGQVIGYLLLLPPLLCLPQQGEVTALRMRRSDFHPLFVMILAFAVAMGVGGPGMLLLPMLVLLWAGLVYAPLVMAWASLVTGIAVLALLPQNMPLGLWPEVAARVGFAFWLVLPIALAILRRGGTLALRRGPSEGGVLAARVAFRQEMQRLLDANCYPLALLRVEVQMQNPGPEMQLAERFAAALRKKDVVGQLSARDFVLALSGCPPEQASRVADRLLKILQSDANFGAWFDLQVGIATLTEAGAALDQALALADQALLQSKQAGEKVVLNWQSAQNPSRERRMAGAFKISTRPP